jgi:ABC-type phosphate/phosphonate transport system substrate-binding protein
MSARFNWLYSALFGFIATAVAALPSTAYAQQTTLELVVHPEFNVQTAGAVYTPLIQYLHETTDLRFELITPRDYRDYWRMLQTGELAQVAIDHPHIAAYRMRLHGFDPLVRANEPTKFLLITNLMADTPEELADAAVSTMPSPSLGYAVLNNLYPNPLRQPTFVSEALSWRDAIEIVFGGDAQAAMVPDWLARRYPNLYPVYESDAMPGTTLTVSPEVSEEARTQLAEALLSFHENPALREVQVELNVEQFEPARRSEYAGVDELLSHAFGYRQSMEGVPPIEPAQ